MKAWNPFSKLDRYFRKLLYTTIRPQIGSDDRRVNIFYDTYGYIPNRTTSFSKIDVIDNRDTIYDYSDVSTDAEYRLSQEYVSELSRYKYDVIEISTDISTKGDMDTTEFRNYKQFKTMCYVSNREIVLISSIENTSLYNKLCSIRDKYIDNTHAYIYLLGTTIDGMVLTKSSINKIYKDVNIEENYNDDFVQKYESLLESLSDDSSGLYILSGLHGTGKTTLIRNLIYKINRRIIFVPTQLSERLSSPEVISFLLKFPNSILILEDSEGVLRDRVKSGDSASVSNILNISDGILGDALKFKIICTFNADHQVIDKALLRKGRLKFKYTFNKLCLEKTNNLLAKLGLPLSKKELSLSDIYNMTDEVIIGDSNEETKKIGF